MPRTYDSDIRRARAVETRRAIVDAAVAAFTELGWFGTTMPAVAERAGVAVETVYRAVPGGKAGLLIQAVHAAVAGSAERADSPPEDRPGIRRAIDASTPEEALSQYASTLPGTWTRVGPLLAVLDSAGPDESLLRLRSQLEEQRLVGMRQFAIRLEATGRLRIGIPTGLATDLLWAVCSRANFDALVGGRDWSHQDYIDWVVRTLTGELLQATS